MIIVKDLPTIGSCAFNDLGHDYFKGPFPCKITSREQSQELAISAALIRSVKGVLLLMDEMFPNEPLFHGEHPHPDVERIRELIESLSQK